MVHARLFLNFFDFFKKIEIFKSVKDFKNSKKIFFSIFGTALGAVLLTGWIGVSVARDGGDVSALWRAVPLIAFVILWTLIASFVLARAAVPDESNAWKADIEPLLHRLEKDGRMRREFTANVSHELKTPLTSILGYAEILANGIARAEDMPRFAGKIHTEAERLLRLVEDSIKLSQLDEDSIHDVFEEIDLYRVAETVLAELSYKAERRNVKLILDGEEVKIRGLTRIVHDMLYNLCDNGIIYNKAGGSVTVTVSSLKDSPGREAFVSVKDTGIGIALEERDRVFERFYRIDKSRSKESGGTGLGLSIVKHAAELHNAKIALESVPGLGTEIRLTFLNF